MATTESVLFHRTDGTAGSIILTIQEEQIRHHFRSNLEALGHKITEAKSAQEALDIGLDQEVDVVVIDADCPGGHDQQLLDQLNKRPTTTVLVARNEDEEIMTKALEVGIKEQITKPTNPVLLIATIESALESQRLKSTLDVEREKLSLSQGIDMLTGTYSHTRMRELLAFSAAAAARYGYPLSIVLLELDNLERIETSHGRDATDRVLCEIADHLVADLRSSDVAGRWTDQQFIVILPHTDLKGAKLFSERLRLTLGELPVSLPNGVPVVASASFGCAQGTNTNDIVVTATDVLLKAKRSGGNTVL